MKKQKENNKERKPTDEEIFLSNLKDHPYADSFKGTIKSLEELIEKGVMK